jgi:hypothetical protein
MTSKAKIAANRRNAACSTGPRTAAGKARSRRNALWHGLSSPVNPGDSLAAQVATLVDKIRSSTGVPAWIAQEIAEARINQLRASQAVIDTIDAPSQQTDRAGEILSDEARVGHAAASFAKLAALVRYERRARSRFNKTLRLLDLYPAIEALAEPIGLYGRTGRKHRSGSGPKS